jgi:hypothetical protein
MADHADVRSIAALQDWQAALTSYGETLAEALAGINLEIRRASDWLEEQLARWQRAVRDCHDEVTRARAELAQRKMPTWDGHEPDCTVQEKNLRKAQARLAHAEDQVAKCRQWIGRLPKQIDEIYTGPARRLGNFLDAELPKGLADLARRIALLESYAGLRPDYAPGPSVAPPPPPRPSSSPASPEPGA